MRLRVAPALNYFLPPNDRSRLGNSPRLLFGDERFVAVRRNHPFRRWPAFSRRWLRSGAPRYR